VKLPFLSLLLIVFIIISTPKILTGQNDTLKTRPKIGLVLSGGGAKGLMHIGVLKLIEKHNIPIDYITGTSMGSIVGALYSIGYSASEIERIAKNLDWEGVFDGSTKRRLISIEEKDQEGKYVIEVPVKKGIPVIPTGLISGQKLEMELAKITWSVHDVDNFSKFPIPFACIATDIETGKAVVLKKGYLPDALRASMAIPSVFTAVEIDNKLLVDGGLVKNFPVSNAIEMGADIIIGVDVQAPLYTKKELTSMLKIMEQAASFINDKSTKEESKLVDILIKPNIEGYDASSFGAVDSLLVRGEEAALLQEQKFVELKKQLDLYADSTKAIRTPPTLYSIFINKVRFEGLSKVSKATVKSRLQIKDSSWVSLKDIEKGVAKIYGSKYFEKVNYRIEQNEKGSTDLIIRIEEQPFTIYKIGINYNNYFDASLLLNGTYRNIIGEGSRLLLSGKLGSHPEFMVDYSIFTPWKPSIGFRLNAQYYNSDEIYYGITDSLSIEIGNNSFIGMAGFASSISNSLLFTLGARVYYKRLNSKNANLSLTVPESSGLSFFSSLNLDTYDRNVYPNKGALLFMSGEYVFKELKELDLNFTTKYWKFLLNYNQYFPLGKRLVYQHFVTGAISLADNLLYSDRFFMGGEINYKNHIFPLTGYRFMEIMSHNIGVAGVGLRYEPWQGKYVFLDGNAGIAENSLDDLIKPSEVYYGGSFGIGIKTVIGPIEYKISTNSFNHKVNHWIQIGYRF
jgi:NTE family protein